MNSPADTKLWKVSGGCLCPATATVYVVAATADEATAMAKIDWASRHHGSVSIDDCNHSSAYDWDPAAEEHPAHARQPAPYEILTVSHA